MTRGRPVVVGEFRSLFHHTVGGPDKTIIRSAADHDPDRVRIVPFFLVPAGDPVPGLHRLAEAAGVEPILVPDRGRLDPAVIGDMRRRLERHGCRILHTHDYKTNFLGRWIRRGTGLRLMSTAHGWSRPQDRKLGFYNALDLRVLRGYPTVLAVSRSIHDRLLDSGVSPDRVRVLSNGVDIETWTPGDGQPRPEGLPREGRVVGTVCRLSGDKDLRGLIEAFARIASRVPDATLVLAGDGPQRPAMEQLAADHGLSDRIRFLGRRDDVLEVYRALDVFVLSSHTEGLPNSVLEAMAVGLPLVAHAVGGIPDLIESGKSGILVPPGDTGGLAAAMERLLTDREEAARLGAGARHRAETSFSFERRLRLIEGIYETVDADGRV